MTQERSECCGANLYQYEDRWGLCGDCKEWAQSQTDADNRGYSPSYGSK